MSDLLSRLANLSPEKRELVLKKLQERGLSPAIDVGSQAPPIVPVPRDQTLPLSFAQQRLWFIDQWEPGNPYYNIPTAVRLTGPLDVAALEQSLNEVVRRHEALRTTFVALEGRPVQVIAPVLTVPPLVFGPRDQRLPVVDLRGLAEAERGAEARRLASEEARWSFDLARGPLVRVTVLRLDDEEYVLLLNMHHVVSDGWSTGVFIQEMATLYQAFSAGQPSPLPELPIQYADFAVWQRGWLRGEVLEKQLAYWKKQLADAPAVLELPTDRPRPPVQTYQGTTESFVLSESLTAALQALSREEGSTLFMTLLAAFDALLYRYTGQEDIPLGSPIANRNRSEIEGLIGFFVNTLVLRTGLSGNPTFRELLGQVREMTLGAYAHQDVPFEMLVDELQPERDLSRTPLFQVMFVLQNAPMPLQGQSGLTFSPLEVDSRTAKFDLTLFMVETAQGLSGTWEYNTDLFDAATVARAVRYFQTLLEGIVADPDHHIADVPILTETERHQLLVEWNDTEVEYPQDQCIHELFEEQVERTPDAVAVVFKDQHLTYQELNRRANQLACHLQTLGVGPETLVGVCVERSPEMVVGLVGILKAGGSYVPLDPAYPQERLTFILEDTQAPVLLAQQQLVEGLPEHRAEVVCLDAGWEHIARERGENPVSEATSENLAYVIYTSGSTGRPKGVVIEHRSAVALIHWARKVFDPGLFAGTLASTSICFDLSVFELFAPLSCGGTVILAETALYLPTLPAAEAVTLVNTVPSAMKELMRVDGVSASVRTVNLAGELLQTQLVEQIYRQETVEQVFDLYGPSEDTTYSTYALRSATGPATIGRPIANTQVYLLDARLNPVPVGVPGELYIGGDGVVRGYLYRPALTAERFIPDPFSEEAGARLYRTGDLARYLPDGNIEFLGRIDHQVKVRGYRIELGEIEAVLGQQPSVRETVVLAREDEPGDKRLVAYVVPNDEHEPAVSELRRFLQKKLPEYMVPSAFVTLEALPLTPNGKVDRRTLPAPDRVRSELEGVFVAPRTPAEEVLAGIWAQVLGVEQVGVYDSFFELGGHSLLATQVVSRIRQAFQVELPLRDFFGIPTVAGLAQAIDGVSQVTLSAAEKVISSEDFEEGRL